MAAGRVPRDKAYGVAPPMAGGWSLSRAWWPPMQARRTKVGALFSLCAIQDGLNTIQEVALIERLGQIADDPQLEVRGHEHHRSDRQLS